MKHGVISRDGPLGSFEEQARPLQLIVISEYSIHDLAGPSLAAAFWSLGAGCMLYLANPRVVVGLPAFAFEHIQQMWFG